MHLLLLFRNRCVEYDNKIVWNSSTYSSEVRLNCRYAPNKGCKFNLKGVTRYYQTILLSLITAQVRQSIRDAELSAQLFITSIKSALTNAFLFGFFIFFHIIINNKKKKNIKYLL